MKVVLITGASTGIGKACALALDKKGYKVFAGVRKTSDAEALKSEASENLRAVILDVTKEKQITDAVELINTEWPQGLHALINNAGIAVAGPLEFIPLEKVRQQLDVNIIGLLSVTQKALPLLRKTKGRVINIGSVSGRVAFPFIGPYNASKFALEGMTDSLRMELSLFGIKVVLVEPGPIATPIWEKSSEATRASVSELPPQALEYYSGMIRAVEKGLKNTQAAAIPVSSVVKVIVTAIEKKNPSARYLVGSRAKLQVLMKTFLTTRMFDKVVTTGIKIGSGNNQYK